jgi:hypothetical protein
MAVAYNVGTNIITVTGYTAGVPCTFTDIYNADKAGTLSLHARAGIVGVDGASVAVDRAERPADYVVLGGASNDLYIVVTNWNGTNATIRITGTDRDGAAQTEDIVVNANGTYNTTKWFKTITHTQVTAFAAVTFDYDLSQGQWGVVWRQSTIQFLLQCILVIGDGSIVTHLTTIKEQITFETSGCGAGACILDVYANATFISGELIDATKQQGKNGSSIIIRITDIGDTDSTFYNNGTMYLYATHIACINDGGVEDWEILWIDSNVSACRMYQVIMTNCRSLISNGTDAKNMFFIASDGGLEGAYFTTGSTHIWAFGGTIDVYSPPDETGGYPPLKTFYCDELRTWSSAANYVGQLQDYLGSLPLPTTKWDGAPVLGCYIKWYVSMDIKVMDKDNNPVIGATVTVKNKNAVQEFSSNTDVNGEISEKIYVVKDEWSGAGEVNTRTDYNDFEITIEKTGYLTHVRDFTAYKSIDCQVLLGTQCCDWTIAEKEQIRSALGVNGDKTSTVSGEIKTDTTAILLDTGTDGVLLAATATSAQLIDDVWDEILTGATHNIPTSAGRRVREIGAYAIDSGTAQAGNSHSITLAASASANDGVYNRNLIVLTDNTGVGQTRTIVDYDGTTKIVVVDRDWRVSPDATTEYQITPDDTPLTVDHGVARGGTNRTITIRDYAASDDDAYLCNIVTIIAGTGRGQARLVGAYDGTTKVVTICGDDWVTTPDTTSVYVMMPYGVACAACMGDEALTEVADAVWDEDLTGHTTSKSGGWFVQKIKALADAILAMVT